jgi:hypothetical protein
LAKRFKNKDAAADVETKASSATPATGAVDADVAVPATPAADVEAVPSAPATSVTPVVDVEVKASPSTTDVPDAPAATPPAATEEEAADEPLEDDDAFSKADGPLKKRRDLRDGIIALMVLVVIVAAPAIGAAVQPPEQPVTPVAEEPPETKPTEIVPVVEREPSFVPLVVNTVKADDTALTGTGNPGFVVRVVFAGQERPSEATVGQDGIWRIMAPADVSLKAGDEKVLDITQNDPATSASYRPGATTPSKPPTQENTVVANNTEEDEITPEDEEPDLVWYEGWTEQRLVREARDVQELITAAWTETVIVQPAVYEPIFEPDPETGEPVEVGQKLVSPAITDTIEHSAEYTTVHYPAEYETIYHEGYWG